MAERIILFGLHSLRAKTRPTTGEPQVVTLGALQEVTLNLDETTKGLRGQDVYEEDVATTGKSIKGTAKFAHIRPRVLNTLAMGGTETTGRNDLVEREAGTPAGGPPPIVTVAGAAQFVEDGGVEYDDDREPLLRVTSSPADGQYSVNESTGVYTFSATDTRAAAGVLITYMRTQTDGSTVTVNNRPMGIQPEFSVWLRQEYKGGIFLWVLDRCVFNKLGWAGKNDDYTIPDVEFAGYADASGRVYRAFAKSN